MMIFERCSQVLKRSSSPRREILISKIIPQLGYRPRRGLGSSLLYPPHGSNTPDPVLQALTADTGAGLNWVERQIKARNTRYLVSDTVTAADAANTARSIIVDLNENNKSRPASDAEAMAYEAALQTQVRNSNSSDI